jgi:hypothetical protein
VLVECLRDATCTFGGRSSPNTAPTTGAVAAIFIDSSRPSWCAIIPPFDMPAT